MAVKQVKMIKLSTEAAHLTGNTLKGNYFN